MNLRIFDDSNGKTWEKSVKDHGYEILCISQVRFKEAEKLYIILQNPISLMITGLGVTKVDEIPALLQLKSPSLSSVAKYKARCFFLKVSFLLQTIVRPGCPS